MFTKPRRPRCSVPIFLVGAVSAGSHALSVGVMLLSVILTLPRVCVSSVCHPFASLRTFGFDFLSSDDFLIDLLWIFSADWAMRWIGSDATFAERLVAFAAVEVSDGSNWRKAETATVAARFCFLMIVVL